MSEIELLIGCISLGKERLEDRTKVGRGEVEEE
jgi:hypothetical protein